MRKLLMIVGVYMACVASAAAQPEAPKAQKQFADLVAEYSQKYDAAPNELKKSSVLRERDAAVKALLPNGKFDNWVMPIQSMGTTGDGDAYIRLGAKDIPFTLMTSNNSFSDASTGTLIKHGSKFYNTVADMEKGDMVVASGKILDIIAMTERGKIVDPDFLVKFSAIALAK